MIQKKIHQIFFNIQNKKINEIKLFIQSRESHLKINNDFKYKLWNEKQCDKLIKNKMPQYYNFYKNLKFDIQRIDFMKYAICYLKGGIYTDLDMVVIKNFTPLIHQKFFFHTFSHLSKTEKISNDFFGCIKGWKGFKIFLEELVDNYNNKIKIKIYNVWTARFVLQTTGPRFLTKFLNKVMPSYKPQKLIYTKFYYKNKTNDKWKKLKKNDYFMENFVSGSWLNSVNKNLKTHKTFK